MPILGYPAHPEHDQVAPAAVVFGVSDPDDTRVRIPRRLLVDIVAAVVDALDVDTDQAALVDYLAERFADRVVLVCDVGVEALVLAQRAEWHVDVSDYELAELAARAEYDEPLADWERELLALPLAESGVSL